jgi:hypothetical protein
VRSRFAAPPAPAAPVLAAELGVGRTEVGPTGSPAAVGALQGWLAGSPARVRSILGGLHSPPPRGPRSSRFQGRTKESATGTDLIWQRGGRTLNDAGLSILRVAMSCPRWSRGSGMNLATRWIDSGAVASTSPPHSGRSVPGGFRESAAGLGGGALGGAVRGEGQGESWGGRAPGDKRRGASTGVSTGGRPTTSCS